jgi:hypothetical protein
LSRRLGHAGQLRGYRSIADLDADLIDTAFDEMFQPNVKSMLHSVKAALRTSA